MDYIPLTEIEKEEMLKAIGVKDTDTLFDVIAPQSRIKGLNLPKGVSEHALLKHFSALNKKNVSLDSCLNFRGAGIYEHFIPSLVGEIASRSEFTTAYTPYQPEASQGTLQTIFEYQSLISLITGLDVSNASLYDGASAAAEAALLAIRATGRKKLAVSYCVHPEYRQVIKTYLQAVDISIVEIPHENGVTSLNKAKEKINDEFAAFIIQSPNFFGSIENTSAFKESLIAAGVLFVNIVNPISLGALISPQQVGADIVVGEGQVLGNASGFGGFTFGFLSCTKSLAWKMPGRVVGQTIDKDGKRGFVLTLQSREQHIRREKATSNICTNSALNALCGCVYLAGCGPDGLKEVALTNMSKARYAFEQITAIEGFKPAFNEQIFFNEFAVKTTKDVKKMNKSLLKDGIIGPLELEGYYADLENCVLFCVTETKSKQDIDKLVNELRKI